MRKHPGYIIIPLILLFSMTFLLGCGMGGVKTPKYPGRDAPIGKPQTPPPENTEPPQDYSPGSGGGSMLTPPGQSEGNDTTGRSLDAPVPPTGASPVSNRIAEPLQKESSDEGASEEKTKDESAKKEESAKGKSKGEEAKTPYRDQTPSKYTKDLGEFAFYFNNADEGPVGELNQLLKAIDLLKVNQQKYDHAKDFLTAEAEGLSRGDPLFIPDQVPEELRPLIPGEGISGAMDEELLELFKSQVEANLRVIPINIVGVMEQGGRRSAIGTMGGSKFQVNQGQTIYMRYYGWYYLGITGTLITEDLVILSLALYQYTGRGMSRMTDPVPRSFHIGIT